MGIYKLFTFVTVTVSAILYGVINKLYIPKPKRTACPLPPKEPKSKKSKIPPKRAAKESKQRTSARGNGTDDEVQAEPDVKIEEQITSTPRHGTKDQMQTNTVADKPKHAISTPVNGNKIKVQTNPAAVTQEQKTSTPVGKPKNQTNAIIASEHTSLASPNGVKAGEQVASSPVSRKNKQAANVNASEDVQPIFSRKRKDRTPRRPVPSLPSPPQRPITPLPTPSEGSGYGTAIEGILAAPGNGRTDQRQANLVAKIKEQIAPMPAMTRTGEPKVQTSAASSPEQHEPINGRKRKDRTSCHPAPPAPSTSSASRDSAVFQNPASKPSQAPMEMESLLDRKRKDRTPPRAVPSSSRTPPRTSSSSIDDTAIETSFPTPPQEFASLFEMVEPGNTEQATNLSNALSALQHHMSSSLRIIPGTSRTATLITLIQDFYFTWSDDRALPTSGSAQRRSLMAREVACLFLARYGRALWPSPRHSAPHLVDRSSEFDRDSHIQPEQHADYAKISMMVPRRDTPMDMAFSPLGQRMAECVGLVFDLPVEKRVGTDWRVVGFVLDDPELAVGGEERLGGRMEELPGGLQREITGEW